MTFDAESGASCGCGGGFDPPARRGYYSWIMSRRTLLGWSAVAAAGWLLAACGPPLVARSPEALYALAEQQIASANYSPAADTLARAVLAGPESEPARRARVVRLALLGGMARGYQQVGESYLAGSKSPGAAAYSSQMRTMALDYFGRARSVSLEMMDALDRMRREPLDPLGVQLVLPAGPAAERAVLVRVRRGEWVEDAVRLRAERAEVGEQIRQVLAGFAGTGGPAVDPAALYLAAARELVTLSGIFGPEALREPRSVRLYHERALQLAERAGELAAGRPPLLEESARLQALCRDALTQQ